MLEYNPREYKDYTVECSVKFSYCMKSKFMSDVIQGVSSYEINNSFDYFYTLAM